MRIDPSVWREEVDRFAPHSSARATAQRERRRLEQHGISASVLLRCEAVGVDGTRLRGLLKAYVPINDDPPSMRPFGMIFAPGVEGDGHLYLELLAFGERHARPGTRTVYERAHWRLYGRYPDR